jgi:hypothetical protein
MAAQAAVCTSMLAAVLLERGSVLLPNFPRLCLEQLYNAGPQRLLWVLIFRQRLRGQMHTNLVLLALFLTTLCSQFTSTIPLSGVHTGPLNGRVASMILPYGMGQDNIIDNEYWTEFFWKKRPTVFPSWAEYSEPVIPIDGTHDTGTSLRALLPLGNATQRESLIAYNGIVTIVDSRVICTRPHLKNVSIHALFYGLYAPAVIGLVSTNLSGPGVGLWCDESCREQVATYQSISNDATFAWQTNQDETYPQVGEPLLYMPDLGETFLPFKCSTALRSSSNNDLGIDRQELPVVMCSVDSWTGILSPLWNSSYLQYDGSSFDEYQEFMVNSLWRLGRRKAYLVIKTTGKDVTSSSWTDIDWDVDAVELQEPIPQGEWLKYPVKSPGHSLAISLSLCFTNFDTINVPVEAVRASGHLETKVNWDKRRSAYDTADLRFQLGVSESSPTSSQRSVFNLSRPRLTEGMRSAEPYDIENNEYTNEITGLRRLVTDPVNQYYTRSDNNFSVMLCTGCEFGDYGWTSDNYYGIYESSNNFSYIHPAYAAIFNDVLREADHPADAIQSVLTALHLNAYYEILDRFTISQTATTTSIVQALRPDNASFLFVVTAMIVLHLLISAYISLLFAWEGRQSLLGNTWSCMAQTQTPEVVAWLDQARLRSDKEVEQMMRRAGQSQARVPLT